MAEKSQSVKYKRATINTEDNTLVEYLKDSTNEFDLMEELAKWNGIDNINITISKNSEI